MCHTDMCIIMLTSPKALQSASAAARYTCQVDRLCLSRPLPNCSSWGFLQNGVSASDWVLNGCQPSQNMAFCTASGTHLAYYAWCPTKVLKDGLTRVHWSWPGTGTR